MLRSQITTLGSAVAVITACSAPPVAEITNADMEAIRASHETWSQAMESGDFQAAVNLFTVDAVVMPPNRPAIQGRDAIRAWYEASPRLSDINFEIIEVDGHANLAFVRGKYSRAVAQEGVQETVIDTGKFLEVRHRVTDGSWLITVDMFSPNVPTPP